VGHYKNHTQNPVWRGCASKGIENAKPETDRKTLEQPKRGGKFFTKKAARTDGPEKRRDSPASLKAYLVAQPPFVLPTKPKLKEENRRTHTMASSVVLEPKSKIKKKRSGRRQQKLTAATKRLGMKGSGHLLRNSNLRGQGLGGHTVKDIDQKHKTLTPKWNQTFPVELSHSPMMNDTLSIFC